MGGRPAMHTTLAALLIVCHAGYAARAPPKVHTPLGTVTGSWEGEAQRFAGIPYAVPPVGERRFLPAELSTSPWPATGMDGTAFKPPCIQNPAGNPSEATDPEAPPPSEDCLTLNIWRKGGEGSTPLPVMIYIFGGGLCTGAASNRYFNGSNLATEHDVLVLTLNHRLGALGFLVTDHIGGMPSGTGGMNGMHDQIVALQWVHRYIRWFGGDPERVTLFGQSSGSYSICTLSVAPAAKGLFQRVVMQSGPCLGGPPGKGWGPMNATFGRETTDEVMRLNGVTDIAGLRRLAAEKVQWPPYLMNNLTVAPYFSGYFEDSGVVPGGYPVQQWRAGALNPSELIIGHTSKDGTAAFYGTAPTLGLVPPDPAQHTEADYVRSVRTVWGSLADDVLSMYPLSSYGGSPQSAFVQADADAYVICPSIAAARFAAKAGRKVYMYEFAHYQPSTTPNGFGCDNGVELDVTHPRMTSVERGWATHGADFRYVFGTEVGPDSLGPPYNLTHCLFTPPESRLSRTVQKYWTSLASSGNPNTAGAVQWPLVGPDGSYPTLLLSVPEIDGRNVSVIMDAHASECEYWNKNLN